VRPATQDGRALRHYPLRLIGDRAYDSDPLDGQLAKDFGIELIAPHRDNRVRPATQDGRALRRYKRRWVVERFFAWLHNSRRLVTRWERHVENFVGMLQLGCMRILLNRL
jgi:transposase